MLVPRREYTGRLGARRTPRCLQRPNPRVVIRAEAAEGRARRTPGRANKGPRGASGSGCAAAASIPSLASARRAFAWAGCRRNPRLILDVLLSKMVRRRSPEVQLEAREPTLDWQRFAESFRVIEQNVEKVVQGKQPEIRLALAALVAEGHILIEDVPGVGKTMLAKAIARSIDCSFRRIHCPPPSW